jgi:hypothetical protein
MGASGCRGRAAGEASAAARPGAFPPAGLGSCDSAVTWLLQRRLTPNPPSNAHLEARTQLGTLFCAGAALQQLGKHAAAPAAAFVAPAAAQACLDHERRRHLQRAAAALRSLRCRLPRGGPASGLQAGGRRAQGRALSGPCRQVGGGPGRLPGLPCSHGSAPRLPVAPTWRSSDSNSAAASCTMALASSRSGPPGPAAAAACCSCANARCAACVAARTALDMRTNLLWASPARLTAPSSLCKR